MGKTHGCTATVVGGQVSGNEGAALHPADLPSLLEVMVWVSELPPGDACFSWALSYRNRPPPPPTSVPFADSFVPQTRLAGPASHGNPEPLLAPPSLCLEPFLRSDPSSSVCRSKTRLRLVGHQTLIQWSLLTVRRRRQGHRGPLSSVRCPWKAALHFPISQRRKQLAACNRV